LLFWNGTGPDFQAQTTHLIRGDTTNVDIEINLFASVLHLRGLILTKQPIRAADTGSLLLWNGEVFDGLEVSLT
jgi:asparagine synthetase B (glutamine-hydrolysing)